MEYRKLIQPIVDASGMGWYFDQIIQEIEESRVVLEKGVIKNFLDENKPGGNQLLFIEAKTGTERRAYHAWAELNGFQHCAIITDLFPDVFIFHCTDCKERYYESELHHSTDWSTIDPGVSYGIKIRCPNCSGMYYPDDPEYSDVKKRGKYFNAVVVAKELPPFSKEKLRKHKRKRPIAKSDDDINLLDKIPSSRIKIIT